MTSAIVVTVVGGLTVAIVLAVSKAALPRLRTMVTGTWAWIGDRAGIGRLRAARVVLLLLLCAIIGVSVGDAGGGLRENGRNAQVSAARGRILSPKSWTLVRSRTLTIKGTMSLIPGDRHVWLVVQRGDALFPESEIMSRERHWTRVLNEQEALGHHFSLVLLVVNRRGQLEIEYWQGLSRYGPTMASVSPLTKISGEVRLDVVRNLVQGAPRVWPP